MRRCQASKLAEEAAQAESFERAQGLLSPANVTFQGEGRAAGQARWLQRGSDTTMMDPKRFPSLCKSHRRSRSQRSLRRRRPTRPANSRMRVATRVGRE